MKISQILDSIYLLPEKSKSLLEDTISEVDHPKGKILLKADKIETNIFFIKKGIVRAYSPKDGSEITFWFGKEGDTVLSMKSYVASQKGYENIELLEDCGLFKLKSENLQKLFLEDIHIANWGRKLAEKELLKTEERLISSQFRSASERYRDLMRDHSDLLQRVQLGYIASYLGITQVTLSRIRAEIK
ncbi:Crp/Fnr family transcriptional regulator [Flavitalea sp.]|nr:Crp/Fnr family transcriptional regulator [Flavitalea sp.]